MHHGRHRRFRRDCRFGQRLGGGKRAGGRVGGRQLGSGCGADGRPRRDRRAGGQDDPFGGLGPIGRFDIHGLEGGLGGTDRKCGRLLTGGKLCERRAENDIVE